jgi:hypothetical protein
LITSAAAADEPVIMPHNKQKVICNTLTIVLATVAIILLGLGFSSSYSSVAALSLESVIHHQSKVFDKKQQDGGSSAAHSSSSTGSSDTKSSDRSNNEGNNNNNKNNNNNIDRNNNQVTNDGNSNSGAHDDLQGVEPANTKTREQQQRGIGESIVPSGTAKPSPQTTCEQGSNCTDQQGLSDHDRSTTAITTEQDNTPFVLSLPFP